LRAAAAADESLAAARAAEDKQGIFECGKGFFKLRPTDDIFPQSTLARLYGYETPADLIT
jgi:hypothetical protein